MPNYVLKLQCQDQVGIVAKVSRLIASHTGWITSASQFADEKNQQFFMRVVLRKDSLNCTETIFKSSLQTLADELGMSWTLVDMSIQKRTLIFASRDYHCVSDLLSRHLNHDLDMNLLAVIANHPDHEQIVKAHGVAYHHISYETQSQDEANQQVMAFIQKYQPDLMILARFMRILPEALCQQYYGRIINIHHSFLPAFVGKNPYERALDAGVKMIGATCHYVTPELDKGPIIEQDVIRIQHHHTLEQIKQFSRDIEKITLAKGVRYHLEERIMLDQNKTLIFD